MHFVQIGINNHQYPLMDEAREEIFSEVQINMIIANQLGSIFSQCQSITKNSCIKVLSKKRNMLISSKTSGKVIHEKDMQLLTSFEVPFYSLNKELLNYKPSILKELCLSIKGSINHACELCMHEEKSEASAKCMDMCLEEEEKKPC